MAWLGPKGETGPAFKSLIENTEYYNNGLFKASVSTTFQKISSMNHTYVRVARYKNNQNPGNLWYHDHAMHITQDNVGHGLLGNYIIFDQEAEKQLPKK